MSEELAASGARIDSRIRALVVAVVIMLVGLSIFAVVMVPRFLDQQAQLDMQRREECTNRRDGRLVLRQVVIEATPPGRSTDFTKVPGFSDLDPAMQTFLNNLSNPPVAPGPTTTTIPLRDRLLPLIPEITC